MAKIKIKHAKTFDDLPTPRHTAVMDEIENEKQTDRAVAIIGAAYIDLVLRNAISARLLQDVDLLMELFENSRTTARVRFTYSGGFCTWFVWPCRPQ